jgi:2-polyprenyl-3-methyl-5-hydroxy-6-metoxy-1,4-benzoquinol methylase
MKISELPFITGYSKHGDNRGYPELLPFEIVYNSDLDLISMKGNNEVSSYLKSMYEEGSLVEGSLSVETGSSYVPKVLSFLDESIKLNGISVFEIGCGNGSFLNLIKDKGAKVIGLEPGLKGEETSFDFPIISDFFPTNSINSKFDLIFSYGVLEHIENYNSFIKSSLDLLKTNGVLSIIVPNCQPYINDGDLSMFIHEHYNYFTPKNLRKILNEFNMEVINEKEIGGVIAVSFKRSEEQFIQNNSNTKQETISQFTKKEIVFREKLKLFFEEKNEQDIAVYVPNRSLNSLFLLGKKEIRLIDDNENAVDKYLPFFENKIENFESLKANPPKYVLIYSRTFGKIIKEKCMFSKELNDTKVYTIDEL